VAVEESALLVEGAALLAGGPQVGKELVGDLIARASPKISSAEASLYRLTA